MCNCSPFLFPVFAILFVGTMAILTSWGLQIVIFSLMFFGELGAQGCKKEGDSLLKKYPIGIYEAWLAFVDWPSLLMEWFFYKKTKSFSQIFHERAELSRDLSRINRLFPGF